MFCFLGTTTLIIVLSYWNFGTYFFLILQLEYEIELFPLANLAIELKIEDLSATLHFEFFGQRK